MFIIKCLSRCVQNLKSPALRFTRVMNTSRRLQCHQFSFSIMNDSQSFRMYGYVSIRWSVLVHIKCIKSDNITKTKCEAFYETSLARKSLFQDRQKICMNSYISSVLFLLSIQYDNIKMVLV